MSLLGERAGRLNDVIGNLARNLEYQMEEEE
jgi:hypothetical protein